MASLSRAGASGGCGSCWTPRRQASRAYHYPAADIPAASIGYGLFGAAEELSDEQISHIIATNLTGSIQLIRASLPHLRAQGGGRIIQISSYGGQVAFPGNSLYHATKWGIEGFAESVAQEVAPFGIGMTIVEPGGARTEFRYGARSNYSAAGPVRRSDSALGATDHWRGPALPA